MRAYFSLGMLALDLARVLPVNLAAGSSDVSMFPLDKDPEARSSAFTSDRILPLPFVEGIAGASMFPLASEPD
jgi:hypothetical protein